ncbi:hypothetical protein [Chengkuizengella axinellae]|uniref:Uncharacterized protein n=1 Tax=Chengkuizengella axinellae TaxID=3064388 RepID=A0ABT9IY71_9BACL|nr:hypothetical protein [Chengkuizengella sp. 2205SS18-9]MDP5274272.1 hypothetical protein [Chengkuizengella sp. 2205SS18-9]
MVTTIDLILYDVEKDHEIMIKQGTPDYYFMPLEEKEDGTIMYRKIYFDINIEMELHEYKYELIKSIN